jgi:hypothetical protein
MKKNNESLAFWMSKFLEVGQEYSITTTFDDVIEGVFKGVSFDTLHFVLDDYYNLYIDANNVMIIKKGGLE